MKTIEVTLVSGQRILIPTSNIARITPISNEDFDAKTRIELKVGGVELVMESIAEVNKQMNT